MKYIFNYVKSAILFVLGVIIDDSVITEFILAHEVVFTTVTIVVGLGYAVYKLLKTKS